MAIGFYCLAHFYIYFFTAKYVTLAKLLTSSIHLLNCKLPFKHYRLKGNSLGFFSITWTTSQKTNFLVILISKFRTFNEYKIFEKIWRRNKIIENEYLSKALCNKQIEPFQKKSFNRNVFELWSKQINNNKNQAFSNKIKALQFFCEYYTICAHYNLSTHKF